MSEMLLSYRGTVSPWHCDHMGHTNVRWYVAKFDKATWQLFARLGLSRARALLADVAPNLHNATA